VLTGELFAFPPHKNFIMNTPDQRFPAIAEEIPHPICPCCGQSDLTQKVSLIYFESLAGKSIRGLKESARPAVSARAISRRLAPPSVGSPSVWGSLSSVHPDLVAIVFAVAGLFLLYQIGIAFTAARLPGAVILFVALAIYLAIRRHLIGRYRTIRAAQDQTHQAIQEAIQRWSRLYYCARDDAVFDPSSGSCIPPEQMMDYLSGKI
jgi:hypothetical protein